MDSDHFDTFTEALGETTTRRQAVTLIAKTIVSGALAAFGIARSVQSTSRKQNPAQVASPIQFVDATNPEVQALLGQAEQNSDFLALRDFYSIDGFAQDSVTGTNAIMDNSSEIQYLTVVMKSTYYSNRTVHLNYAKLPNGDVLPYGVTLDANQEPLVGFYRNSKGQIVREYPSSILPGSANPTIYLPLVTTEGSSQATSAAIVPSSVDTKLVVSEFRPGPDCGRNCNINCQATVALNQNFKSHCGLDGLVLCVKHGLIQTPDASNPGASLASGLTCDLSFRRLCRDLDPNVTCSSFCNTACADCHGSPPSTMCLDGEPRAICNGTICQPNELCGVAADGVTPKCIPNQDVTGLCNPGYHYMGRYAGKPACCVIAPATNCEARSSDGTWIGCCIEGAKCHAYPGGYYCAWT